MSLPTRTLDQILSRVVGNFRTAFPGFPLGFKKFLGRTARGFGKIAWGIQKALEDLDADVVPSAKMSSELLADWLILLGLPDGAGSFGPLVPTAGTGGVATLTGVKGTVYANALTASTEGGAAQIRLDGSVTIPGGPPGFGSISGIFAGITTGSAGNVAAGTVCTWDNAPAGADPSFTLTSPIQGAIDAEDNPGRFSRIEQRLQDPPRGGNSEDITIWSEVDAIAHAYVYPLRGGIGTADAVVTTAGSGQGRKPSVPDIALVQASFDSNRAVGAERITALAPYMPDNSGHLIIVKVRPAATKYNFDWIDTAGGPFTVDTYTPGSPNKLKLNTLAPSSLKNAITNFIAGAGEAPRLQVLSTGSVVNVSVAAIAFADSGGKTELTLETPESTWVAPTAGDAVYAFGPVVSSIAGGILDLVDSLGPSRVSGFGDTVLPWGDILTISGLIAVAENAFDTDGSKLIAEVPPGLATIDGLNSDLEGTDNNAPEILYASHIAVIAAP